MGRVFETIQVTGCSTCNPFPLDPFPLPSFLLLSLPSDCTDRSFPSMLPVLSLLFLDFPPSHPFLPPVPVPPPFPVPFPFPTSFCCCIFSSSLSSLTRPVWVRSSPSVFLHALRFSGPLSLPPSFVSVTLCLPPPRLPLRDQADSPYKHINQKRIAQTNLKEP